MRLVPVDQLHSGDRLARDVCVAPSQSRCCGRACASPGHYLDGLVRAGVRAVYVDDALSDGIEPNEPISERTREEATRSLHKAFGSMTRSDGGVVTGVPEKMLATLKDLARMILEDVTGCGEAAVAINDLATHDRYTLQHSIDVTAIGLVIAQRQWTHHGWIDGRGARRWDRIEQRLVLLGQALLLHDVGKLGLPPEVLQKPGPLTPEEFELVYQHPDIGYAMLAEATVLSPLVKDVVRHHHERWDGSGLPERQVGSRTSQFSRIAGMADVFDAISSERPYKAGRAGTRRVRLHRRGGRDVLRPGDRGDVPANGRAVPAGSLGRALGRASRHRLGMPREAPPTGRPYG